MPRGPRISAQGVWCTLALAVLAGAVLLPFALVLGSSFQTTLPGEATVFGFETWRTALADNRILGALQNTVVLAVVWQSLALAISLPLAWLVARTDLPYAGHLEFLFWIAFFLPALPVTLGWILLLEPQYGLLNQLALQLPWVQKPPFNIYSFWGIIWAHLAQESVAIKIALLAPALRNLDSSLEEAALTSGASRLETLVRIVFPLLLPAIVVVMVISVISSLQSFEVEVVLGTPFRFLTFSTLVFQLMQLIPPRFGEATVLSSLVLGLVLPLILAQRWLLGRRSYATVSGRFRFSRAQLGRWRWPAFALVLAVGLTTTALPLSMLVAGTFMKLFGFFFLPEPWTTAQWGRVLGDPIFANALSNTLTLSVSVAGLGVVVFTLVAFISVRTSYRARGAVDFVAWLPSTLPGIILGLGFLWLILGAPLLRPLYGSMVLLVVCVLITSMTLGVQTLKGVLVQLGTELEEAARVGGGTWWDSMRYVVLPLIAPSLILVAALSFLAAARDVSTVALLSTGASRPLAMLQLSYMVEGRYESAAVVGVIVVILTTGVALLARAFGSGLGVRAQDR